MVVGPGSFNFKSATCTKDKSVKVAEWFYVVNRLSFIYVPYTFSNNVSLILILGGIKVERASLVEIVGEKEETKTSLT